MDKKTQIFASATLFECGLGFLGVVLAWWFGLDLRALMDLSGASVLRGLVACLPMFAMLMVVMRSQWQPLVQLRLQVEAFVRELFAGSNWFEMAVISASAGVGEEVLFRGVIQHLLSGFLPVWIAIVMVSLFFGLAHALSPTYFVIATLIGAYLGWLLVAFDDLIAPIIAHGVYDFVALMIVQRRVKEKV